MKLRILIVLLIVAAKANSQSLPFDTLLERAKTEFKRDSDKASYGVAIEKLKQVLTIKPNNAEALYFLGYAYSRYDLMDATMMDNMQLPIVIKASRQFELLNQLHPNYDGEKIVLDSYSKLSSEWGSMAMCYLANHKPDSAVWALREGKKRGGFDDFILSECRMVLSSCSEHAILVSCGDDFCFPILYLQLVDNYRTDVGHIEISLLNTKWYPRYLDEHHTVAFDIKQPALDTIDYQHWSVSGIDIPVSGKGKTFSWMLAPSFQKEYILRGDRLFLSILRQNGFKRDVYFTKWFAEEDQLSLRDHLINLPAVDKVNGLEEPEMPDELFIAELKRVTSGLEPSNKNSTDENMIIGAVRYAVRSKIARDMEMDKHDQARALIKAMDDCLPEKDFPYTEDDKEYLDNVRQQL